MPATREASRLAWKLYMNMACLLTIAQPATWTCALAGCFSMAVVTVLSCPTRRSPPCVVRLEGKAPYVAWMRRRQGRTHGSSSCLRMTVTSAPRPSARTKSS